MIGVIAGDVIGSVHEHALTKSTDFPLFDPRCRFRQAFPLKRSQ
jgi:hypothetical protein